MVERQLAFLALWRQQPILEVETPTIIPVALLELSGYIDAMIEYVVTTPDSEKLIKDVIDIPGATLPQLKFELARRKLTDHKIVERGKLITFSPEQFFRPDLALPLIAGYNTHPAVRETGCVFHRTLSTPIEQHLATTIYFDPAPTSLIEILLPIEIDQLLRPYTSEEALVLFGTLTYYMIEMFQLVLNFYPDNRLKFVRKPLPHYAVSSIELQVFTTDWIPLAQIVNRGTYDLDALNLTNTRRRTLQTAVNTTQLQLTVNHAAINARYQQPLIAVTLASYSQEKLQEVYQTLLTKTYFYIYISSQMFIITSDMVTFTEQVILQTEEPYTPSVIEVTYDLKKMQFS